MKKRDRLRRNKLERDRKRRLRQEWLDENGPCKNCGSTKRLEAHHEGDKKTHRVWSMSEEKRRKELKKCIVLCRSCHLERHYPEPPHGTRSRYRSKRYKCRCAACRAANAAKNRR